MATKNSNFPIAIISPFMSNKDNTLTTTCGP